LLINGHFGFPKWGLFGAAFATVLGTVAAAVMSVRSLFSKNSYVSIPYIRSEKVKPRFETVGQIMGLGSN
ncbi:MAG: MATE family efflux transporter, partial [Erysipelotrichaceae bacterium]|nr:MATE family efflux transporter [Erysipelotrichaceae bacterium]